MYNIVGDIMTAEVYPKVFCPKTVFDATYDLTLFSYVGTIIY